MSALALPCYSDHPPADLFGNVQRFVERHRSLAQDAVGQPFSLDILHHQREDLAGLFQPVNGGDVGVIERSEHGRFAAETRQPLAVAREQNRNV
jgi:hypothetical protein